MTAAEALRRARATMRCEASDFGTRPTCALVEDVTEYEHILEMDGLDPRPLNHRMAASVLLDGFSVEEVTAAEHTTDQPHE